MVQLDTSERQKLELLVAGGKRPAREVKLAQILLAADGGSTDEEIASTVQVAAATVYQTRRRFVEDGLDRALAEDPRPGGKRKLSTTEEAMLVALACALRTSTGARCAGWKSALATPNTTPSTGQKPHVSRDRRRHPRIRGGRRRMPAARQRETCREKPSTWRSRGKGSGCGRIPIETGPTPTLPPSRHNGRGDGNADRESRYAGRS
ncbi:MAG: helix-turn-helix domain-containing protein [Polyangia bacterium]